MSDFKAKMHQNTKFGWGSAQDPAEGVYSAPQTPELNLRGLLLRGGEGRGVERREGEGREGSVVESKKS